MTLKCVLSSQIQLAGAVWPALAWLQWMDGWEGGVQQTGGAPQPITSRKVTPWDLLSPELLQSKWENIGCFTWHLSVGLHTFAALIQDLKDMQSAQLCLFIFTSSETVLLEEPKYHLRAGHYF